MKPFRYLSNVWNYDFRGVGEGANARYWMAIGVVPCLLSGILVAIAGPLDGPANLLLGAARGEVELFGHSFNEGQLHILAYLGVAFFASLMIGVSLHAFFVLAKRPGRESWHGMYWANYLTHYVDFLMTAVVFLFAGTILRFIFASDQSRYEQGEGFFNGAVGGAGSRIDHAMPRLYEIPFPFSVLMTVGVLGLSYYLMHRLFHTSRLFWLLAHRAHHVPTVLHPVNVGPVAIFGFLFAALPQTLVIASLSGLFPSPMTATVSLVYFTLHGASDVLSHNSATYAMVYRSRILRGTTHFFSTGVYHYMHHSSKPDEQMVNLDAYGPFMIWDRLFGTYRPPTETPPVVGLSNSPEVRLNPFLIAFGGFQQIVYELRMNRSMATRAKILFGSVGYKPPISYDYLIVGYAETPENAQAEED